MTNSFEKIVNIIIRAILAEVVFVLFLHSILSTSFIVNIP